MPAKPRKSRDQWEGQKETIIKYYNENTLKKTVEIMREHHDFEATQKEFRTRLETWGILKNLKKKEWEYVHQRTSANIPTSVRINGKPISDKRQKRAVGRYTDFKKPSHTTIQISINCRTVEPPSSRGITFRTPSPCPSRPQVKTTRIPGLRFLHDFSTQYTSVATMFPQGNWAMLSEISIPYPLHMMWPIQDTSALLKQILWPDSGNRIKIVTDSILSRLASSAWIPNGDTHLNTRQQLATLLLYSVYLFSNNHLRIRHMDLFLRFVLRIGATSFVFQLMMRLRASHLQTMEIFLSHLLLSAVSIEEEDVVSALLQYGVDPNFSKLEFRGTRTDYLYFEDITCSLQMAIVRSNLHICRLLVNSPPDVAALNRTNLYFPFYPFEISISMNYGNAQIFELLVGAGANMNLSSGGEIISINRISLDNAYSYPTINIRLTKRTLLMKAVEAQNYDIVAILLQHGVPLNHFSERSGTALQIAVAKNDMEMVDLLIKAGAEVNIGYETLEFYTKKYFLDYLEGASSDKYSFGTRRFDREIQWEAFSSPIQIASRRDNLAMVKRLLDAGAAVNYYPSWNRVWSQIHEPNEHADAALKLYEHMRNESKEYFQSALHIAVKNGNIDITRLLLQEAASINNPNAFGETVLQLACGIDQSEFASEHICDLVKLLIDCGADIYASDVTPVEIATTARNSELMYLFSRLGIAFDIDVQLVEMYNAISSGKLTTVRSILHHGIDINAQYESQYRLEIQESFLQVATREGHVQIAQELLEAGADVDAVVDNMTALCTAVELDDWDMFNLLLTRQANPNIENSITPLALALVNGRVAMVAKLIETGANVNVASLHPSGDSPVLFGKLAQPLFWVLYDYDAKSKSDRRKNKSDKRADPLKLEEMVSLLLSHGADADAGPGDSSVLHFACQYLNESLVGALINRGAIIDPLDPWKPDSPISCAARRGVSMFSLLIDVIDVGACVLSDIVDYIWSLGRCAQEGNEIISKLVSVCDVQQRGGMLVRLIGCGFFDATRQMIEAGADVNVCPADDWTPLSMAAWKGRLDLVRLLLDRGADINPPVWNPPLTHAAASGNLEICKLLLENGVDLNARDCFGSSPLHIAAARGYLDISTLLLENGADSNARDSYGLSALQRAAKYGRLDVVHLLLENDRDADTIRARCKEAALDAEKNEHHQLAQFLKKYQPDTGHDLGHTGINNEAVQAILV